jgi:hypothetical protein
MTLYVPRLAVSVDPLISEAKRRMKQRRFLIAVLAFLVVGGSVAGVLALRSRGPVRPLMFRSPTKIILAKAQTGAPVSCRNARMTTKGRVPAPGQPSHGWAANWSGYAPGLWLTRRSDGSLVVHCY